MSLVQYLCEHEEYVSVTVITRKKLLYDHPKLDVKIRSFDELEEKDIEFAHELFCCLGTTMKQARSREAFEQVDFHYPLHVASLAKKRGIPHFLVMSAIGASENRHFTIVVKGKNKDLIAIDFPQLSIIRPSLLIGQRMENRFGKLGKALLTMLKPMLIGPLKRLRAMEAKRIAYGMMLVALYSPKAKVAIFTADKLAKLKPPVQEEEKPIAREELFNWDKRKSMTDDVSNEVVDEEVVFKRREQ